MAEVQKNVDVVRQGKQIIVPEGMEIAEAMNHLERKRKADETAVAVHEVLEGYPLDGAYAMYRAIASEYKWGNLVPTPGFFGPEPPHMINVEVAPGEVVQIPWGRVQIPSIDGFLEPSVSKKDGKWIFVLSGAVKRKHLDKVRNLADIARMLLRTESIYRGRAVKLGHGALDADRWNPEVGPQFMDVSKTDPNDLILSEQTERQVFTSLFTPIEHTEKVREAGIPLKRGALLDGVYGVGKSMTGRVMAKKAVENGWSFIYVEDPASLADAVDMARSYQPAIVFSEDIDQVLEGDRDGSMNDILNTIDGIDSKSTDIFVVLTTNHLEKINKAMLRPGRFDCIITVELPDAQAVERLIRLYGRKCLAPDEDLSKVGPVLQGQIPAVIREVVERAKLYAIGKTGKLLVRQEHLLEEAKGMLYHMSLLNRSDKKDPDVVAGMKVMGDALIRLGRSARDSVANSTHAHVVSAEMQAQAAAEKVASA